MKLTDALKQVAIHGNLDAKQLAVYAREDDLGGAEDGHFSGISIGRAEGRLLYALVRALRPSFMVEIGTYSGCSATHILSAMERNDYGHLHSLDLNGLQEPGIPSELKHRWSIEQIDARYYNWPEQVDILFEDGDHTRDLTSQVVAAAKTHGAWAILSHDAHNASVGGEVCAGFEQAVGKYNTVLIDGPVLGLAYWFRDSI